MKNTWFLCLGLASCWMGAKSQSIDSVINDVEVERVERILSADDMQGRAVFTPGIEKAASFISEQFRATGLKPLGSQGDYRQPFSLVKTRLLDARVVLDGKLQDPQRVVVFSSQPTLTFSGDSRVQKVTIKPGDDFRAVAFKCIQGHQDALVLVDTSFSKNFQRLEHMNRQQFTTDRSVVFVLSALAPAAYRCDIRQEVTEDKLANLVGVLPGTTKKNEYVIFSAHYDHLGIGQPNQQHDSIYNGANDDASGTTAVILLAKYFSRLKNNERTLVFATFTAEEIGEYGSQYFSSQFDPAQVAAMFNIEMIGTQSKWGINSAYLTGYERTDMGQILERNLLGTAFRFYPDPYPEQQLFYRSDNASLARQGVPAHTISTSKMDSEKYYHTQADEISTLDLANMTRIIRAIALSSSSIVAGRDTPSRIDATKLR
jgi:Zn-dependent M28 family amino/carboxypeptidase